MGIPKSRISNLDIAQALPSTSQISRIDLKLGAACSMCICWEIVQDNTVHISWQFDHGKRKGKEHFLKVISWGGMDELGDKVIKAFCIDAGVCGHTAKESAESIKDVADLIKSLLPNSVFRSALSDSGGGGAIQCVDPFLRQLGVLEEDSIINHCSCHGMNKPLENGLKKALGDAGIGHNTPWQLLYLADCFLDNVIEDLGLVRVNDIWAEINTQLLDDARFQDECYKHGGLVFTDFYKAIQTISEEDPSSLDKKLYFCPTGRRDRLCSFL